MRFPRPRNALRDLFRKEMVEGELDQEVFHHIELETQKNIRPGMDPKAARRKAMMDFGGVERFKEQTREVRGVHVLEVILTEVRYAVRRLRRAPLFTAVAIITLVLGIGASTAIHTLLERVALDPLPFPGSERLVRLKSPVPVVGRLLDQADDQPGAPMVGVLSHALWRQEFGSDPQIVGGILSVNDQPVEIVGVAGPGLDLPSEHGMPRGMETELWVLLGGFLFGVTPSDPAVYLTSAGVVSGVALLASWLPSRRAARIRPVEALRVE